MLVANETDELIELRPIEATASSSQKHDLLKTDDVEVVQFNIPAGRDIPTHEAQGEILLHCMQGKVAVTVGNSKYLIQAGQLAYFRKGSPISILGIEDASLLVTIIALKSGFSVELIGDHS